MSATKQVYSLKKTPFNIIFPGSIILTEINMVKVMEM